MKKIIKIILARLLKERQSHQVLSLAEPDPMDSMWQSLGDDVITYNWSYRQRVCMKCSLEQQGKRKCFRVDNYRIIDGKRIQETHCDWLMRARANKFRTRIKNVFNLDTYNFLGKIGMGEKARAFRKATTDT